MGSFDDGGERRSGVRGAVVTQVERCVDTIMPRGLIPALGPSDLDPLDMMGQGFP